MKRSFLQNSARRTAFVLAMLLLLGGTPVQAAENTTACKNQQPSMESRVCPLLLPPVLEGQMPPGLCRPQLLAVLVESGVLRPGQITVGTAES